MVNKYFWQSGVLLLVLALGASCVEEEFYEKEFLEGLGVPDRIPPRDPIDPICDPLSGGGSGQAIGDENGLLGKIRVAARTDEGGHSFIQSIYTDLDQFDVPGNSIILDNDVFMTNLGIYPRSFSEGFPVEGNGLLMNPVDNTPLVEWFRVDFETYIKLPDTLPEGQYEIATISDDGVEVSVDDQVFISNPDTHSPTIDCSSQVFSLNRGSSVKLNLRYFQGPRTTISLMLMWRRVDNPTDPLCSSSNFQIPNGNSYAAARRYIDNYIDTTNFNVIPPEAFFLPGDVRNPCI